MPTEQTELTTAQTESTTEQSELIEKVNCLEFETSQLNQAYQLWRSYLEQGKAPEWMAAAIRITYDDLIRSCLDTVSNILADVPGALSTRHLAQLEAAAFEISGILGKASTTAEPSAELLPRTEPDWSRHGLPAAIAPLSTGHTISTQRNVQPSQQEEEADVPHGGDIDHTRPTHLFSERHLAQLETAGEISGILGEESTTEEPSPESLPMTEPDWFVVEMPVAISPASTGNAISDQPAIQQDQQEEERLRQLWGKALVYDTAVEPSPELLPRTEPDWFRLESRVAISPLSTADPISEQPAIQQDEQEEEAGVELAIPGLATLAKWLQGSSTGMLFLGVSVAILIVAGGAMGIYVASAQHAAAGTAILPVHNSSDQGAAGALAIPTGGKAGFKFDPDPEVAHLGSSFVLNAVLSRGSDIASMAVQIDYDANLLKFVGVSKGRFLVKDGRQVVLAQRDDPSTGVLGISVEKSPGDPGISGDGPVFALAFQARKKGMATVSIVPGAHDSQGRRIEMAGSQVSVRVN